MCVCACARARALARYLREKSNVLPSLALSNQEIWENRYLIQYFDHGILLQASLVFSTEFIFFISFSRNEPCFRFQAARCRGAEWRPKSVRFFRNSSSFCPDRTVFETSFNHLAVSLSSILKAALSNGPTRMEFYLHSSTFPFYTARPKQAQFLKCIYTYTRRTQDDGQCSKQYSTFVGIRTCAYMDMFMK